MKNYIKLFISIILLTLSQSTFSMEADPTEIDSAVIPKPLTPEEEHNLEIAIFLCPDEVLLKIINHGLDFKNAENIFEALECVKMHRLNIVCCKFRALMKDKTLGNGPSEQLHSYYKNIMRELFVEQRGEILRLKNIKFNEIPAIDQLRYGQIIEFLREDNKFKTTSTYIIPNVISRINAEEDAINCIKLLVFYGAGINAQEISGAAPLNVAVGQNWIKAVRLLLNHPEIIIDIHGLHGKTPLMSACHYGKQDVAELLLNNGANPNLKATRGFILSNEETPLIFAAKNGQVEIVKLLLSLPSIEIDTQDNNRLTALMWAAYLGKPKVVKLLLEKDANTKIQNHYRKTAKDLAHKEGFTDIEDLIEQHESSLTS